MEKTCQKCGSPASQIPPKAEWGTEVISQKTGKKYFVFLKCDNCSWSLSSDPKPRRFANKPQNSSKQADNSTSNKKFEELMAKLEELGFQLDAIEALLRTNKEV